MLSSAVISTILFCGIRTADIQVQMGRMARYPNPYHTILVPFERIRPVSIPQQRWEETFAWPANNEPPYPPLTQRIVRGIISHVALVLGLAILLQVFSPFPVLTWIGELIKTLVG
jgi:hypothetical protein